MVYGIIIYLFIVAIIIYDVIKYQKNKIIEKMRNGEINSVKIKWKIVSIHYRKRSRANIFHRFFKVKWENKEKRIFCSQEYPSYWSIVVKEWDSINIYLNETNPKYYYIDDVFIINKYGVSDDYYKTGFIRFVSSFLFLLLLLIDIAMFADWISSFLDNKSGDLTNGIIFVWTWILAFRLIIYLFQLIWGKKKYIKEKK